MIGEDYWAGDITLYCHHDPTVGWTWRAKLSFQDSRCVPVGTSRRRGKRDFPISGIAVPGDPRRHGVHHRPARHTRFWIPDGPRHQGLSAAIDVLKADAERLGIRWRHGGSGWSPTAAPAPAPDALRALLAEQADRLGWDSYLWDSYL